MRNVKCMQLMKFYLALQHGCDRCAGRIQLSVIWGKEIYRQQKYFIHTDHRINVDALYVSSQFYDTLNAEEQSWFQEAADRAAKYAEQEDCEKEYEQKMEAAGIQISREPNVLQAEMREASQTLVLDYLVEEYGEDKVKKIWMMLNDKEGKIPEFPDYEKQETPVRSPPRNSSIGDCECGKISAFSVGHTNCNMSVGDQAGHRGDQSSETAEICADDQRLHIRSKAGEQKGCGTLLVIWEARIATGTSCPAMML